MAETEVRVALAEGMVIGPEDRLVVTFKSDAIKDRFDEFGDQWRQALVDVGLDGRVLAIVGDVELTKVEATSA